MLPISSFAFSSRIPHAGLISVTSFSFSAKSGCSCQGVLRFSSRVWLLERKISAGCFLVDLFFIRCYLFPFSV